MATNYWVDFEEGGIYHIYNRGNNRENIFKQPKHYNYFISRWKRYVAPYMDLYAFCLMPNHFHLIAHVKEVDSAFLESVRKERTVEASRFYNNDIRLTLFISAQFRRMFSSFALGINKDSARIGSLFQKRFKRIPIDSEHKLLDRLCYVHHNPIHHRVALNSLSWKHSSYLHYKYGFDRLVSITEVLRLFDANYHHARRAFVEHHRQYSRQQQEANTLFYLEHS